MPSIGKKQSKSIVHRIDSLPTALGMSIQRFRRREEKRRRHGGRTNVVSQIEATYTVAAQRSFDSHLARCCLRHEEKGADAIEKESGSRISREGMSHPVDMRLLHVILAEVIRTAPVYAIRHITT